MASVLKREAGQVHMYYAMPSVCVWGEEGERVRGRRGPVYGDNPLIIFGGKVTKVTDKAVVIEPGTRVTLPAGFDASRSALTPVYLSAPDGYAACGVAESLLPS
jgi:hypothetical protein